MRQRRKYSEEFKREAVGLTRQPGSNVSQTAQGLGIRANMLWRLHRVPSARRGVQGLG